MKIQTFSIVIGTRACDAHCPFCVSRMTGFDTLAQSSVVDEINFAKACRLAEMNHTTTVLMTGKGEPTLYPAEITNYLEMLQKWQFPFVELQTNGLNIGKLASGETPRDPGLTVELLRHWRELGLNTVALSTVGVKIEDNSVVYSKNYPDLAKTIHFLHSLGFTVRLGVMMLRGMVDSVERVQEVIAFCREHGVEQLTVRPIRRPKEVSHSDATSAYVMERGLTKDQEDAIAQYYLHESRFKRMMTLPFGAAIVDVDGQNLCLTDALNEVGDNDEVRTLIFYSDGRLTYSWDHDSAAVFLGGRHDGEINPV